ncbi:MAG: hypothetical protein SXU28_15065, partial [Pseudomonadota bacterium]|nr:hypothetical protein [Pseudomonadota bacterium]
VNPSSLPAKLAKKEKWTTFAPPAATLRRRYRGLILHRRSHEQFLNTNVRNLSHRQEDFFLGAVAFTTIILGGRGSALSQLVEQFIPQAFFRLQWLSDVYAERTGYLVEASDRYLEAARAKDMEAVRQASRSFFDGTAPALHKLADEMAAGSYPPKDRHDGFHTIEPKITGAPTYAGSARAMTPLLSPLGEREFDAHPF